MSRMEPFLTLKLKRKLRWHRVFLDSLLALGSIMLLTGLLWRFRLYPLIPDSFLVYLLAILSLASLRGLYAALLASFVAFFSFDVFLVPPLYTLSVTKFEDVLTLIVFLIAAIITSQFAFILRQRAEDANRRERETHLLYDLVRATNSEEDLQLQLSILVRSVVEVFSPWGIRDCLLLLPDDKGRPVPHTSACQPLESIRLSPAERAAVEQVLQQAHAVEISYDASMPRGNDQAHTSSETKGAQTFEEGNSKNSSLKQCVRMIPLKKESRVIGVLRLLLEREASIDDVLSLEQEHPTREAVFFSTFLEQAVTLIERGHLRQQSMRMKVLQQTDALRSALLSSVSHDLRTPLGTIKTAATSLLEEQMEWNEEARRGFASAIVRETDRLNNLVENLLDMSRIEAGSLRPEKVWYPLDALVHDVLDHMQPLLEGRAVQVTLPDLLPPVEIDTVLIEQVLINLFTNAISYTPADSPIDVSIQLQQESVVVSVADRGPGIAPAEQERIFDKFYRVAGKEGTSEEARGLGLGLAICRGLVEAHGGRIWVESREGGGAVFRFTLPLENTGELDL